MAKGNKEIGEGGKGKGEGEGCALAREYFCRLLVWRATEGCSGGQKGVAGDGKGKAGKNLPG
jgi:hypothetical protein